MMRTIRPFSITPLAFALLFACSTTMSQAASVDPAQADIDAGGTSGSWDAAGESSAEAWDKTKKASGDIWEATKETSADAWGATKEFSGDAWDKTKEVSSDAWDATKEGSTEAWESTKEWVDGPEGDAPVTEPPAVTTPGDTSTPESHTEI